MKQVSISQFLLFLSRFSFTHLSMLAFRCPSLTENELREVRQRVQETRYPFFVMINGGGGERA